MDISKTKNFKSFETYPINHKKRFGEGGLRLLNFFKKNKFNEPLISVITVVKNNEKFLEETIKSVLQQNYRNFEYIIIDGGSNDNTLEIINKYSDKIDYWISEDDEGIYDAFNKGMQLARGNLLGMVNSDDTLEKNALSILIDYINKNPKIDFVFGSVKKHWGILHGYEPKKIIYSWGFYPSHSTGFYIKLNSAKKVGLYNLKYKYHADYDFFFRMIVKEKLIGVGTKKNELFGNFRRGGFSSKVKFKDLFLEDFKIRYDNGQNLFLIFIIFTYKFFKNLKSFFN